MACAGDGKADDTAALQRAIAELTAGGRPGVLVIEPGTYVLTAMINVSAPIVLRGAGIDATTLFFPKSLSEVVARSSQTSPWAGRCDHMLSVRSRLPHQVNLLGMLCFRRIMAELAEDAPVLTPSR